jgi:hypothetical protein
MGVSSALTRNTANQRGSEFILAATTDVGIMQQNKHGKAGGAAIKPNCLCESI